MRVTLTFCGEPRSLLFDLGLIIIFREISGVDLIADGDKRDNILVAQTVFIAAYKRACQEDEQPELLDTAALKKAFLRFKMPDMSKVMNSFTSIMNVEEDPDIKKEVEEAPNSVTGKGSKKK